MNNLHSHSSIENSDIAIIGMSGRFPGAKDVDTFWQNLRDGVESISIFSDQELESNGIDPAMLSHPNYVKAGAAIEDVELFDASFFGFSAREAEIIDPQHRLFLECAWEAIESAGYDTETYEKAISICAGVGVSSYWLFNLAQNRNLLESVSDFQIILGNDKDFLPTRVSYKLNLKGPSINVQTACSTSLVAVHLACQSLLSGECDIALAGGVSVRVPQKTGYLYQEGGTLSPDGHCRAFDSQAQGLVSGNGIGVVVLKPLVNAIADRDCIHAIIKGSAINNDGSLKVGYTAPSVDGQEAVISEALAISAIKPDTVTYIETHGTGTTLGDPIEIAALTQAFRNITDAKGFCAIGSLKTNVGHLDAAAGVAALIKTVMALKHKLLPPSLHFQQPNPKIDFANSPFYVNTSLCEWKTNGLPCRAGVSSFGIGGTNAHVILEESPVVEVSGKSRYWFLLVLSAKSDSALNTATTNLVKHLDQHPDTNFADVAYTYQVGRRVFNYRRMLVCQNLDDAAIALSSLDPKRVFTSFQESKERPVVFMLSGQGAQYVNMGVELYQNEPTFREQVDLCSELLKPYLGIDLRHVLYPSEEHVEAATQKLKQTAITQPALFVIEYALAKLWRSWGVHPQAMIGHSIGEYVAACLSEVFSLEDALALVVARGQLMQKLPLGSMLAVPLSEKEVQPLLNNQLSLAAINGSSACVVSGSTEAVEQLKDKLTQQAVNCRLLHTSHAFHSQMMNPIMEAFTEQVKKIKLKSPQIPFISNVTGTWITAAEAVNPNYWAKHLRSSVRFADGLQELYKDWRWILLEVGPGRTLATLARQHPDKPVEQVVLNSLRHPHEQQSDVAFLLTTLGHLWLAGVEVDWSGFYTHEQRHRLPLPTYPFERQRYWIEPQKQENPSQVSFNKKPDIADWFYVPSWKRSISFVETELAEDIKAEKSCYLVFIDTCGLGFQLVKQLEQKGDDVTIVMEGEQFTKHGENLYQINPRQRDDYEVLLKELDALDKAPKKILHLWSVTANTPTELEIESFEESQYFGFYSLLFLVQAIAEQNLTDPIQIGIVSNNMQEVTGSEVLCPEKATLLGPVKVVPQEYPYITCKSIDIVISESESGYEKTLIDGILSELFTKPFDSIVAYRGRHRWVQTFESVRLEKPVVRMSKFRNKGVYLITGGLGEIGLVLAEYLAQTVQARLILIGRSAFPERDNWEKWLETHDTDHEVSRKILKLQALEKLGAEILIKSADVANYSQMLSAVNQAYENFGEIHGVIHAAGITAKNAFSTIQLTTQSECEQHFQPKVRGLFVLKKVLQDKALDFCMLTSSLSSILGGLGFVAYSTANLFMDAFVHRCNQTNAIPWIAVNWDGWKLKEEQEQNIAFGSTVAQLAITPKEGVEVFQRVLSLISTTQKVVISTGNLQARIDQWIKQKPLPNTNFLNNVGSSSLHLRPNLANFYVAPRNETEQTIALIWEEILGIAQLGIYDNFFEAGGDSLLATQLLSRLRKAFQVELPLSSLFETATIAQMAELIEEMLIEKIKELTEQEAQQFL